MSEVVGLSTASFVLAFADFPDGQINVSLHVFHLSFTGKGDGFVHLMNGFHAFAVLVVFGELQVMLRSFEMLNRMIRFPSFLKLFQRFIHLRLLSLKTKTGGQGEHADCGNDDADFSCFHRVGFLVFSEVDSDFLVTK